MFRIRKSSGGEAQEGAEAERKEAEEAPAAKAPPPRRPVPARLPGASALPVDIGRRHADLVVGPPRAETPGAAKDKTMVIGREVRLHGEVLVCERLIVEGEADLSLSGCKNLQIGRSGTFRGTADVSEADIGGCFEGDLLIRDRLTVRSTGRLSGTVRYGQIVIEAGGQITGEVKTFDEREAAAPAAPVVAASFAVQPDGHAAPEIGADYVTPSARA